MNFNATRGFTFFEVITLRIYVNFRNVNGLIILLVAMVTFS